jgi:hypothetical protein
MGWNVARIKEMGKYLFSRWAREWLVESGQCNAILKIADIFGCGARNNLFCIGHYLIRGRDVCW